MENFNLVDWLMSNSAWEILLLVTLSVLPSIYRAFSISRKLLVQNRDTRGGNGWGKHFADRFVDMWYSTEKNPLQNFGKENYPFPGSMNSRFWIEVIDKELAKLGLIERDNATYDAVFKPKRNWRNKFVLIIVEFWLINITGDKADFYKELKRISKM